MTAFEFDSACSYLLQNFDNKRDAKRLEIQIKSIAVILGADKSILDSTGDDEDEVNEDDYV